MENIQQLEEKYLKAKIAYYEGTPFLTDAEFDALETRLKKSGSKAPNQVGSKRKDFDFGHPNNMLSLSKIQTEYTEHETDYRFDEFYNWYTKRTSKLGKSPILYASPKFDGNAINIIYRGGKLVNILTRGDGETGKDVTSRLEQHVAKELKLNEMELSEDDIIEIRSEVVLDKFLFDHKYSETFANPRNYVAGVIGKDDFDPIKANELEIVPLQFLLNGEQVDWYHFKYNDFCTKDWQSEFLANDFVNIIKSYEDIRKTIKYPLDGVVISFPVSFRSELGENEHDPEWAVAIKFVPEETITDVVGVEWNISKRGEIVPTVLLKPVFLDGSTVGRASGYNAAYLFKNNIGSGATVSLHKSGDIIPQITKVIVPATRFLDRPETCSACGSDLSYDGVHLLCPNESCAGRIAKQLSGALKILDIKGIGEKTIEPFGSDFRNMYEIINWVYEKGQTAEIEKYGIKNGSRSHSIFVQAFKNVRSVTYAQVIQMLGYDNVGEKISTQLAREHAGLEYNYAHLEKALVSKLRNPEISDYIKEIVYGLEKLGINIDKPKVVKAEGNVFGVCMTGSPKKFGFKTKKEFLDRFPGVYETSLSDTACKYLITDSYDSKSSKMKTAVKKGIEIKTYEDLKL